MPAPKGMRTITFSVNTTDAVHVYSDAQRIWLQLRRDIPTQQDIGKPSFKTALSLTPAQAIALAGELLTAAIHHQNSPTAAKANPATDGPKQQPTKPKQQPSAQPKKAVVVDLISRHPNGTGTA